MSPPSLPTFGRNLAQWKAELLNESEDTLAALQEQSLSHPEAVERASMESDHALELRARDRARKLINKIDKAIARIDAERIRLLRRIRRAHWLASARGAAHRDHVSRGARAARTRGKAP